MENNIVPYEAALLADGQGELAHAVAVLLGCIPVVGPVLKGLADRGVRDREKKRLAEFLLGLYGDVRRLEGYIRRDYVTREEAADLIDQAIEKVMKDSEELRRRAYQKIIADVLTTEARSTDDARRLLRIVTELSVNHFRLLACLERPIDEAETRTADHIPVLLLNLVQSRLSGLAINDTRVLISDLEREGVLAHGQGSILAMPGQVPSASLLTERGVALLKVTKADGQVSIGDQEAAR